MSQVLSYQTAVVTKLVENIVETVAEGDEVLGVPSGVMYSALMSQGLSLAVYQTIMGTLVHAGLVRLSNDCYHITEKGREWVAGHSN